MLFNRLLLALALLFSAGLAQADGVEALRSYYEDVQTLSGAFEQTTRDDLGKVVERSSGAMLIRRPDRFRWNYTEPFEQQVVADGERLWVYDVDLEQVTARPLDEVLGVGPALLLSGDYASLENAFQIIDEGEGWVRLEPKSDEWDFQSLRLHVKDRVPHLLVVDSGFGQTTELELRELEINPEVDSAQFRFQPPSGVDVIMAGDR